MQAVSLDMSLNIPKGNGFADQSECANAGTPVCVCVCDMHQITAVYSQVT